jgi:hypothetical protein
MLMNDWDNRLDGFIVSCRSRKDKSNGRRAKRKGQGSRREISLVLEAVNCQRPAIVPPHFRDTDCRPDRPIEPQIQRTQRLGAKKKGARAERRGCLSSLQDECDSGPVTGGAPYGDHRLISEILFRINHSRCHSAARSLEQRRLAEKSGRDRKRNNVESAPCFFGGSSRNEVRERSSKWNALRFILKGCQRLAGGRGKAHHRSRDANDIHPEGMTEITFLAPLSGCIRRFLLAPVVALGLPPATLLNRSAVNRNDCCESWNKAGSAFVPTCALDLKQSLFSSSFDSFGLANTANSQFRTTTIAGILLGCVGARLLAGLHYRRLLTSSSTIC